MSDLRLIPGIGPKTVISLNNIGIFKIEDLKGKCPESLYESDCKKVGYKIDRCQLYVYRCAVYYAENDVRDEEKLKWWNWKD